MSVQSFSPPTLLYVKDETLIAMALVETIEDAGYSVLHASTGPQAIAILEERRGALSALVTDIRLPGGLTGWEIARRARELNGTIAVVYVTGDSAADWSSHGVPKSFVVQKPFAEAQVLAAITTLLNEEASALHQSSPEN